MVVHSRIPVRRTPCWVPPGVAVQIGDITVTGGLFYTGTTVQAAHTGLEHEPSFVNSDLPVGGGIPYAPAPRGGYSDLAPLLRFEYLRWLAAGRPEAKRWIIDLFVCGIERRWMEERSAITHAELGHILQELEKLAHYPAGPAAAALRGLILAECRATSRVNRPLASFVPTFPNHDRGLTLAVVEDCGDLPMALPSDWAIAALLCRVEPLRDLGDFARFTEARQLFAIRYRDRFGDGVTPLATAPDRHVYIPQSARREPCFYRGASSTRASLDDSWEELDKIATSVLKELAMYRHQCRNIAGLNERIGRAGGLLPPDLARLHAKVLLHRLTPRWHETHQSVTICSRELASQWPTCGVGLTPFTASNLAAALHVHGFRLEPDPACFAWAAAPDFFSICRCGQSADDRLIKFAIHQTVQRSRGRLHEAQLLVKDMLRSAPDLTHAGCVIEMLSRFTMPGRTLLRYKATLNPDELAAAELLIRHRTDNHTPSSRLETDAQTVHPPSTSYSPDVLRAIHDDEVDALLRRFQRDTMRRRDRAL